MFNGKAIIIRLMAGWIKKTQHKSEYFSKSKTVGANVKVESDLQQRKFKKQNRCSYIRF